MADTNNPASAGNGEAAPAANPVDALADILDDPAPDTEEATATDAESDDPLSEDDSTDETSDAAGKAGPRDESGRFVSPSGKVKLADGTTTTIAELTAGHLRQSDYTRKTQEVSEARKALEARQRQTDELTQQLQTQYQQVNWWLAQTKPERPKASAIEDPLAHVQYREQMDRWDEANKYWTAEFDKSSKALKTQQQESYQNHLRSESEALFKAVPALRDPGRRDAFVTEAAKVMADYGIKREEIAGLTDHRMILILRDAVKYRRLQSKTATVQADLGNKPPVLRGSKRNQPTTKEQSKQRQRTERLLETGSFQDGMAALGHLLD